ncbi:MAG: N-acetylneuraminate synthase family protein [Steroidobacteraceae bacterium]
MTSRITIVAEAAQGFEGDPTQARLLARAAAASGADLVKFQLVFADELALPGYKYFDLFRTLEMPDSAWHDVRTEASNKGVGLVFDVFGERSLELALKLNAHAIKIHATDFFNDALVAATLKQAKEVHLSLGGIEADELEAFLARHARHGTDKIVLLTGYQAEPTPIEVNNLARLAGMKARFPRQRIGWMDHADGSTDEASWLGVLAIPYGISVLEKHITLARPLELEDGVSALDPEAMKHYVRRVRQAELAIGTASLQLTPEEKGYRRRALKSVVALRALRAGEPVSADALVLKRVVLDDTGYPLHQLERAVGRKLSRDVAAGGAIYEGDIT